jgi:hypothetical protein
LVKSAELIFFQEDQNFAKNIGKTKARQKLFNANGALVRPPIEYQMLLDQGAISLEEDPFILLQGDIISTDSLVYHLAGKV